MCRLLFCGMLLGCLAFGSLDGQAMEPASEFLNALRDRGYYDVAMDYLDSAAGNAAVPAGFKETLKFERGATLILGSKQQKDVGIRNVWLMDGQAAIQKFLAEHPESPLVIAALQQSGNAHVERARGLIKRADAAAKLGAGDAQAKFLAEGRGLYTEAFAAFEKLEGAIQERLKSIPEKKADAKQLGEQERLKRELLQSLLLQAATLEETADAFAQGSAEQTKAISIAAERYEKIYRKYYTRLAGLYARMYQARCQQKLGKHQEALDFIEKMLDYPEAPDAMRTFKIKAVALAADSWMAEKQFQKLLDNVRPILDGAREGEDKTPDFIELRAKLERATKAVAEGEKKE
jgi:hypothetical protein